MTTVNTVEDIIEALDANPILLEALRARLLTRELLELPRVVAQLAAAQNEFMKSTTARLDVLTGDVAALTGNVAILASDVAILTGNVAALTDSVAALTDSVAVLQSDVSVLKSDVSVLKNDVSVLKNDVASLKGNHLEMRLQGSVYAMMGQRMNLRGTKVVRAAFPALMAPEFAEAIDSAEDDGIITGNQRGRILSTDLIATARRQHSQRTIYVSFEAAHTLDGDDIRRVEETGDALARVFPEAEIMGFLYGQAISQRDRARAEANGVEVIMERA